MEKNYKNATLAETLSNLVGEKGIKTDVAVKIAPATIPILILSSVVAIIIGILVSNAIMKAVGKG